MGRILLGIFAIIAAVALLLGVGGCNSYNGLVSARQSVDTEWAQVQTVYQRRADLIPNLVSTVSGAANFERAVLREVTEARASVGQVKFDGAAPQTPEDLAKFQQAQGRLGGALSRLLVVSERYPDLKASGAFRDLQAQLEGTENRIAVERQNFNQAVQSYNTRTQVFPTVLVARMFNFQPKPYFQAEAGSEKAPKVEFNFNPSSK